MIEIVRTNSLNNDFIELVKSLDVYLAEMDGEEHSFYAQFNKIKRIKHVIVAYIDKTPVSCGAIREYDKTTMEIKRMFTDNGYRGRGIASTVLSELEKWAYELSYKRCVLETGIRQTEAIGLYEKSGYKVIASYGQYVNVENSRCFEKILT